MFDKHEPFITQRFKSSVGMRLVLKFYLVQVFYFKSGIYKNIYVGAEKFFQDIFQSNCESLLVNQFKLFPKK